MEVYPHTWDRRLVDTDPWEPAWLANMAAYRVYFPCHGCACVYSLICFCAVGTMLTTMMMMNERRKRRRKRIEQFEWKKTVAVPSFRHYEDYRAGDHGVGDRHLCHLCKKRNPACCGTHLFWNRLCCCCLSPSNLELYDKVEVWWGWGRVM